MTESLFELAPGTTTEPDGWGRFWDAYPRRDAKKDALKAYKKLAPSAALQTKMLDAIAWQKQTEGWRKEGGRYVPLAGSWIRGERWEDSPKATRSFVTPVARSRAENYRRNVWLMKCRHETPCLSYACCIDLLAAELSDGGQR